MSKIRLITTFVNTIEVPDDNCSDEVDLVAAKNAIERALECLDGVESQDCRVTGVSLVESEVY